MRIKFGSRVRVKSELGLLHGVVAGIGYDFQNRRRIFYVEIPLIGFRFFSSKFLEVVG